MRCVAVGCKTGRKSGLRIHSFPRDPKRRLEWAVKVNIAENGKLWVPPKDCCYGVCEAHFEDDQYEPRRTDRKLKPFAIPTLFSHRKIPKRRRTLVRGNPAENNSGTVAVTADTSIASATAAATATATTVAAGALTPAGSSAVVTSQQAALCSATNSADAASRAQYMRATSLSTRGVAEPAFTVATSGGNIILVPATTVSHGQGLIIGRPPVAVQARSATGAATIAVATSNGSRADNPNAFTSVPAPHIAAAPAQPHNLGPIVLVPMSQPSLVTAVPRVVPEQSSVAAAVCSAVPGQSAPMPVILSVESLSEKAPSATSGLMGPPPLIARSCSVLSLQYPRPGVHMMTSQSMKETSTKQLQSTEMHNRDQITTHPQGRPPTYDELRREVTTLKQQSADLRRDVCETTRQAARVKAALSRQSERLSRFLRADQVERLVKLPGDGPVRWTEPTLRFALDVYRCSPKAYRALLTGHYPLPSEGALRAFCVKHGVRDSVPPELLQAELQEDEAGSANIVWL